MLQGYISDSSTAAKNTYPSLSFSCEVRYALLDVASVGDFHYMGPEGVGAVPGYDDGRLGLVLGACRATAGPSVATAAASALSLRSTTEGNQFFSLDRGGGGSVADIFFVISLEASRGYASLTALLLVFGILVVVLVEVVLKLVVVELEISSVKRWW